MFESRLLKLNTPHLSGWQTLRRWRWWVAISCGVIGVLIEWLEHRLELHVDVIELVGYGLVVPGVIWWLMTHLAGALAERADTAASQLRHQQVIEQLDKHHSWQEIIQFVVRLPGDLLPVSHARLYAYDHPAAHFHLIADSNNPYRPAAQTTERAACKACVLTHQPHYQSGFKEYCQPLVYDNLLVGVLRLQFRTDALLDQGQLHFLNIVAPRIALALALSIADPQRLMQAKAEARNDERREVAHELHDTLAQQLSYLHLSLDRLSIEPEPVHGESLRQELGGLREIAAEAYRQVRDQLALLRSRQTADLVQSLRYYTQVVSQRSHVRVTFVTRGEPVPLADGLASHVFSLVRESLNNVQRHARAYEAQVVLFWSEDLLIVAVTDDGVGFDPAAQFAPDHHGLAMLRERIDSLHGQLHIHSAPKRGTRLFFYLPLDRRLPEVGAHPAPLP